MCTRDPSAGNQPSQQAFRYTSSSCLRVYMTLHRSSMPFLHGLYQAFMHAAQLTSELKAEVTSCVRETLQPETSHPSKPSGTEVAAAGAPTHTTACTRPSRMQRRLSTSLLLSLLFFTSTHSVKVQYGGSRAPASSKVHLASFSEAQDLVSWSGLLAKKC